MIRQALAHFKGIGPVTAARLRRQGCLDWRELPGHFPSVARDRLCAEVERCEQALATRDLRTLTDTLVPADHWRILDAFPDEAAYLDIETTGTGTQDTVTVVCCYHRDQLHTFIEGHNLTALLDLLMDLPLLVTFNGASFDLPKIRQRFPDIDLPCGHVDLRWVCYHQNLSGGLKRIEQALGIERPDELVGVDGAEAVWLWQDWVGKGDRAALERLCRYCGADVLGLHLLSSKLLRANNPAYIPSPVGNIWSHLDRVPLPAAPARSPSRTQQYERLRALRGQG